MRILRKFDSKDSPSNPIEQKTFPFSEALRNLNFSNSNLQQEKFSLSGNFSPVICDKTNH